MKATIFKVLAKMNRAVLPSFTKRQLALDKASKWQLALLGWRAFVTKNAVNQ